METKGKWIVFEGLDKAGKTTLAKALVRELARARYLKGICGKGVLGRLNRLFPTTIFLMLEALISGLQARILIRKGFVVIQDRYIASVACHLPITEKFPNRIIVRLALKHFPVPDGLVFMTVSKDERIRRLRILGIGNPHEQWLLDNPEWIGRREKAYGKYYSRFPNRKMIIDTSKRLTGKGTRGLLFF